MNDTKIWELELNVGDTLNLNYDYYKDWDIHIVIESLDIEDIHTKFAVTSGTGIGILENCEYGINGLKELIKEKEKPNYKSCIPFDTTDALE